MAQYVIGRFSRCLKVCTTDCNCIHYVIFGYSSFLVGGRHVSAYVFAGSQFQSAKIWYLVVLFALWLFGNWFEVSVRGGYDHEEGWIQIHWRRINDQNLRW